MSDNYTLESLQERIGYTFHDISLLKRALTHSSFTNEQKINKTGHYERLEFLGDAVLELASSDFLYRHYPTLPEGELTKLRASMVCEPSLAFCARDMELGRYIRLGKGEEQTGGRGRDSIVSDVMEALIGAIYLDGGMEPARRHIDKYILSDLEDKQLFYDSKSNLQELVQGKLKRELSYELVEESGPEHDKTFVVEVRMENQGTGQKQHRDRTVLGRGSGRTKKAAEQQAAYQALLLLRDQGYVFKKH